MQDAIINQTEQATFFGELTTALVNAGKSKGSLALLIVHLNNLGRVNTTVGYEAGNVLLKQFAARLHDLSRKHARITRIGARKFAVVLTNVTNEGHVILAANKIVRMGEEPIEIRQQKMSVDLSIGIALCPDHASNAEGLMQRAELALASARKAKAEYHVYSLSSSRRVAGLWDLEDELGQALDNGEFDLYYQPKIDLKSGEPCGAEALLRWKSPTRGVVSPESFIPVADRTGRIQQLTWFALNTALRQALQWPKNFGPPSVSVNVTPNDIQDADFFDQVKSVIGIWDTQPNQLTLEITEEALVTNPRRCFDVLTQLQAIGVRIAIDDFGTGYSSLSYIKTIPANELKIDKSFVLNMFEDKADKQIVRSVIDLAHSFNLDVVAEGVENEETAKVLADLQCDYVQGFYFTPPLPQSEYIEWLEAFRPGAGKRK